MQVGPQLRDFWPRFAAPQDAIRIGGETGDRRDAISGLHAARGGGETLPILVANAARSAAGSISALGLRRCHQRLLAGRPRVAGIRSALAVRDQVAQAGDVCAPAVAADVVALVRGDQPQVGEAQFEIGRATSELPSLMRTSYAGFCLK